MTGEEANNANDPQHVTDTSDDPASGQVPAQHHATPLSASAQSADTGTDTSASATASTTAAHDGNTHTAQVEEQPDGTKPAAKPVFSAFDMSSLPDLRDPSSRGGASADTPSGDGQTPASATRNTDAHTDTHTDAEDQSRAEFTTVYDIIDTLEQQLDEAKSSIFTPSQVRIDRDAFASQLDELKNMLPVQLERASALMREAERRLENAQTQANAVVSSAQSRAADIIRDAQEQAQFLAGQDNITNIAKQKARAILDQAQTQADKLTSGANQYCTDVMQSLQDQLDKLSQDVRGGLTVLDQREREASARLDHNIQSDDYPEA
ncbi:cell division protein [Bifidobacterium apri]|uniref:cell division protein n=1 Tax=Bifidobacterium apri TaxID=1769423 RepID=UPI003991A94F